MAAMLQSSMSSLSISPSSVYGHRLSSSFSSPFSINVADNKPFTVEMKFKRWEHRKYFKPNGKPIIQKMHVKVGDTVKIISGREKGKVGEVMKLYRHNSTVIVKDMNIKTKHVKPKKEDETGEIIKVEGPIHSSNMMLYSTEQKIASRIGHKFLEDGLKVRYLIKTGEIIDGPDRLEQISEE